MTVAVPKRKINFNIENKIFEAKELSARYLMDAMLNPDNDTVDAAILDSMGVISDEDHVLFGKDTKEMLYTEIVKFTFKERLSKEQKAALVKDTGLSESEIDSLSKDAQVQLKNIIESRSPKPSGKGSPE